VDGQEWAEYPPTWALPVTVAGDLTLVSQPGIQASIGALCAYPAGFLFYLIIGIDPDRATDRTIRFRGHTPQERASATRLQVEFFDGRVVDSMVSMSSQVTAPEPVLLFSGGQSNIHDYSSNPRCESRWWVSPLPPPGPVTFTLFLRGAADPAGTTRMDAALITQAAVQSEVLWTLPENGPE
jgi:hypothetical protein